MGGGGQRKGNEDMRSFDRLSFLVFRALERECATVAFFLVGFAIHSPFFFSLSLSIVCIESAERLLILTLLVTIAVVVVVVVVVSKQPSSGTEEKKKKGILQRVTSFCSDETLKQVGGKDLQSFLFDFL